MSSSRQLAAIMFTDMVGYTAHMQTDEVEATKKRQRHKTVFDQSVETHHGKVLQYFGDGTLSNFSSAIDYVNCACLKPISSLLLCLPAWLNRKKKG